MRDIIITLWRWYQNMVQGRVSQYLQTHSPMQTNHACFSAPILPGLECWTTWTGPEHDYLSKNPSSYPGSGTSQMSLSLLTSLMKWRQQAPPTGLWQGLDVITHTRPWSLCPVHCDPQYVTHMVTFAALNTAPHMHLVSLTGVLPVKVVLRLCPIFTHGIMIGSWLFQMTCAPPSSLSCCYISGLRLP